MSVIIMPDVSGRETYFKFETVERFNGAWSVVSYFLRYFSSTSTEQISPIPPNLSPVSIRLALLFLLNQQGSSPGSAGEAAKV
jgi:hypothetical protein